MRWNRWCIWQFLLVQIQCCLLIWESSCAHITVFLYLNHVQRLSKSRAFLLGTHIQIDLPVSEYSVPPSELFDPERLLNSSTLLSRGLSIMSAFIWISTRFWLFPLSAAPDVPALSSSNGSLSSFTFCMIFDTTGSAWSWDILIDFDLRAIRIRTASYRSTTANYRSWWLRKRRNY